MTPAAFSIDLSLQVTVASVDDDSVLLLVDPTEQTLLRVNRHPARFR
jgi:hypothetical protein